MTHLTPRPQLLCSTHRHRHFIPFHSILPCFLAGFCLKRQDWASHWPNPANWLKCRLASLTHSLIGIMLQCALKPLHMLCVQSCKPCSPSSWSWSYSPLLPSCSLSPFFFFYRTTFFLFPETRCIYIRPCTFSLSIHRIIICAIIALLH